MLSSATQREMESGANYIHNGVMVMVVYGRKEHIGGGIEGCQSEGRRDGLMERWGDYARV